MHLLIILLQQLLGMLPSKKVPQPEVVRSGNPAAGSAPTGPEPDACARLRPPQTSWMTPCLNVFWLAVFTSPSATRWSMVRLGTVPWRIAPTFALSASTALAAVAGLARSAPRLARGVLSAKWRPVS